VFDYSLGIQRFLTTDRWRLEEVNLQGCNIQAVAYKPHTGAMIVSHDLPGLAQNGLSQNYLYICWDYSCSSTISLLICFIVAIRSMLNKNRENTF
jgi:hypothetical protein